MTEIVDPIRRGRLKALKRELARIRGEAAEALWEYGTALAEIHRDELWREDGAESFEDWCEPYGGLSSSTAYKAIAIATHFTREMAARFGSDKLDATTTYLEATKKLEQPGDVLALQIRVQGERGRFQTVPYIEATATQIRAAARLVRKARQGQNDSKNAPEPHLRERIVELEKLLPAAPGGTVRGERIKMKRGTDGRETITIQGIAVDDIDAFLLAIGRVFRRGDT